MSENENKENSPVGFNLGQLFGGLVLISVGLLLLAQNAGWLKINFLFDWEHFWPLLIIFAGLTFIRTRRLLSTVIGIIFALILFGLVTWFALSMNLAL
jgi:hypothetical protein